MQMPPQGMMPRQGMMPPMMGMPSQDGEMPEGLQQMPPQGMMPPGMMMPGMMPGMMPENMTGGPDGMRLSPEQMMELQQRQIAMIKDMDQIKRQRLEHMFALRQRFMAMQQQQQQGGAPGLGGPMMLGHPAMTPDPTAPQEPETATQFPDVDYSHQPNHFDNQEIMDYYSQKPNNAEDSDGDDDSEQMAMGPFMGPMSQNPMIGQNQMMEQNHMMDPRMQQAMMGQMGQ